MPRYRIHLTPSERETLLDWVKIGKRKAQHIQYSHILLCSDESEGRKALQNAEIALRYHTTSKTVERVRKCFCSEGMLLFDPKVAKTRKDKKLDGRAEAHLIALVCQGPPKDAPKWKLKMLADRLVELEVVDSISRTTVSKLLKKTNLNLFTKNNM